MGNFILVRDLMKLIRECKREGIKVIDIYDRYGWREGYIVNNTFYSKYSSLEYRVNKL